MPNILLQPRKFAGKNGEVRFNWAVKELSRLCEALYSDQGDVKVLVRGSFDLQRRCLLVVEINANLLLECQTTFEPIEHRVETVQTYCAVSSEQEVAEIESLYDPILMDDGLIDIQQVIEDELILTIPLVANKPLNEVDQKMSFGELDEVAIEREKKASNPFLVLANFKKD